MTAVARRTEPVNRAVLTRATERALHAPSVHNSQPWRWQITDDVVKLYADPNRHLAGTDPDGRDLVISCGAALHHLRVVLAHLGVPITTLRLPDREDSKHLATVHAVDGVIDLRESALVGAIEERRSDRRAFCQEPVETAHLDLMAGHAAAQGAGLVPVLTDDARGRLAAVLGDAATHERSVLGYAAELAIWTGRRGGRDGIPAASRTRRHAGPDSAGLRRFPPGQLHQTPHPLTARPDAATLMVITTEGDDPADWLRAGEAASAVLLVATRLGLASTVLSQAAEVAHTRRQLAEVVLRVPEHAQLILRIGRALPGAATLPMTPRRPLSSVLMPEGRECR